MPGLQSSYRRLHPRAGRGRVAKGRYLGALVGGLLIAGFGPAVPSAVADSTPMVDLGQASTYAVLSGASIGNTVSAAGAPHTTLRGDLGVKANAQPTGFPPGVVTGAKNVGNTAAAGAHADLVAAYDEVAARTDGADLAGALVGKTITPGLYHITGAASNTGTVTLDGGDDRDAVFVFQVGGALTTAALSHVVLTHGAQASHVFWQVNGAADIGAGATFAGTLMALDAVAVGNGTVVNGRALARNGALTLDDNQFYSAPPVITIVGGAALTTPDNAPTISGTTNLEAPGQVTVTVDGQTLHATPASDGTWSVTSAILANDTYPVVASVTDGAQNTSNFTQQLTIDTVPPVVTLDGGPSVTTNDPTPTIGGTSDVASGTVVHVTVGAQDLTALVQSGGTWNVTPAALADGTVAVTASVTDPAGNPGTDSQQLSVDTTAPAVTIAGGATALTNDATPAISGTADVAAGTTVTVALADETLTALVEAGGTWSVTAAALSDGPHRVVMSVADAAGNPASSTQRLTVDTVSPLVAINGGATATTSDLDPTIAGSSDAAPGTIVTVSIAGQTMTTLLQANGTWNATPSVVGTGTWRVLASAPDPAGNVGRAGQNLTIATPPPAGSGGGGPPVTPAPPASPAPPPRPVATPTPAPTPTPTPRPGGARSVNAVARIAVTRNGSQKVKGSSLSIATKVTAPARGRVAVAATGTVKIKGVKKAIKLTKATARIAAGHHATLKLKLKGARKAARAAFKKIRKAAQRGRKVSATITLKVVDAAGHHRTVKRTVKLK